MLAYGSPTLDKIMGKLNSFKIDNNTFKNFVLYDGEEKTDKSIPAINPGNVRCLAERKGWEWFDSIRGEERYKALTERLNNAVK